MLRNKEAFKRFGLAFVIGTTAVATDKNQSAHAADMYMAQRTGIIHEFPPTESSSLFTVPGSEKISNNELKEAAPKQNDVLPTLDFEANQLSPELISSLKQSIGSEQLNSPNLKDVTVVYQLSLDNGQIKGFTSQEQGSAQNEIADLLNAAGAIFGTGSSAQLEFSVEVGGGEIHHVAPLLRILQDANLGGTIFGADSVLTYDVRGNRSYIIPFKGFSSVTGIWRLHGQEYQNFVADTQTTQPEGMAVLGQSVMTQEGYKFLVLPYDLNGVAGAQIFIAGFDGSSNMRSEPTATPPQNNIVGRVDRQVKVVTDPQVLAVYRQEHPELTDVDYGYVAVRNDNVSGSEGAWILVQNSDGLLAWVFMNAAKPRIEGPRAPQPPERVKAVNEAAIAELKAAVLAKMGGVAPEGSVFNAELGYFVGPDGKVCDYALNRPGEATTCDATITSHVELANNFSVTYMIDKDQAKRVGLDSNIEIIQSNLQKLIDQSFTPQQKNNIKGKKLVVTQVANFDKSLSPEPGDDGSVRKNPNYPQVLYFWEGNLIASAVSFEQLDENTFHVRVFIPDAKELGLSVIEHTSAGLVRAILVVASPDAPHDSRGMSNFFATGDSLPALRFAILQWTENPIVSVKQE